MTTLGSDLLLEDKRGMCPVRHVPCDGSHIAIQMHTCRPLEPPALSELMHLMKDYLKEKGYWNDGE